MLAANPRGAGVYAGEQTQLWAQDPKDPQSIFRNDVRQGTAGTCTGSAVAVSLSHSERGRDSSRATSPTKATATSKCGCGVGPMSIPLDRIKTMPVKVGDFNGQRSDPRREIWPKAFEAGFIRGAKGLFNIEFYRDRVVGAVSLEPALGAGSGSNHYIRDVAGMDSAQIYRDVGAALNDQKVVITGSMDRNDMTPQHAALAHQFQLRPNHAYAVLGLNSQDQTVWLGDPHGKTRSIPVDVYKAFFNTVGWGYIP